MSGNSRYQTKCVAAHLRSQIPHGSFRILTVHVCFVIAYVPAALLITQTNEAGQQESHPVWNACARPDADNWLMQWTGVEAT